MTDRYNIVINLMLHCSSLRTQLGFIPTLRHFWNLEQISSLHLHPSWQENPASWHRVQVTILTSQQQRNDNASCLAIWPWSPNNIYIGNFYYCIFSCQSSHQLFNPAQYTILWLLSLSFMWCHRLIVGSRYQFKSESGGGERWPFIV